MPVSCTRAAVRSFLFYISVCHLIQQQLNKQIHNDLVLKKIGRAGAADAGQRDDLVCIAGTWQARVHRHQNRVAPTLLQQGHHLVIIFAAAAKHFFIYCTLIFPHPPYGCEEPWYSLVDRTALPPRRPDVETLAGKASMLYEIRKKQGMQNWGEAQYNEVRAVYLGMVARFDHQLGLLLDKLRQTGVYDNTNVFVFSDHGDYTTDYGIAEKCQNSFEDPLTNVPLLVKPAAGTPLKPGVSEALVQLNDLPATVYEMAGVAPDYCQFCKSLCGTLATAAPHRDAVFCEGGRLHGETQAMEPDHGPHSPYWPRISTQHTEGPAHTKGCMARMGNYKYVLRLYETDEFYDLAADPMETDNRITGPAYAAQIETMRGRMLQFYMETGDFVPSKMDHR